MTTVSPYNFNQVIDITPAILNIDPQSGVLLNSGLFSVQPLVTDSFIFDKMDSQFSLIPKSSRREGTGTKAKSDRYKPFTLTLTYRHHSDHVTPYDLQGVRGFDSFDSAEQLIPVINRKLTKLRSQMELTQEYLALGAVKGVTVDPDGDTLIDMFATFGISQTVQTWDLADPTTNVQELIRQLMRDALRALRTGGVPTGMTVWCSTSFFDSLVKHPSIVAAYSTYAVQKGQMDFLREGTSTFTDTLVQDVFKFGNVTFKTYPSYFRIDGSTVEGIEDDKAYCVLEGVTDLFRSFYGSANTLSGANQLGQPMFASQYNDPRGKFIDLEVESSSAFICTQPQTLIKLQLA